MTKKNWSEKATLILKVLEENPNGILISQIRQKTGLKDALICYYLFGFNRARNNTYLGGYMKDIITNKGTNENEFDASIKLVPNYKDILKDKGIEIGLNVSEDNSLNTETTPQES